ncbi:NUDIX hydrolase [Aeromicrobium ginsengisoli]|uniref:NUDIX hydrolase n=1 Tax=Aeromicrobium ginsengisoli TaxID=363867 RepID=A0A5M4FA02_9ACTN|nr:NUDIX hydrolase [Aeromicrobium ginsengisoli]KAA1395205.1 NUDIX hydrolase [Aeromicrobium ginsengisoli]
MPSERIINAAGGVVWRKRTTASRAEPRVDVLVVHRPSYDDWSFPKGKVDPGEALQATAVREIFEETGLRVRLGPPLVQVRYPIAAGTKVVDYWSARAIGEGANEAFEPNKEVDELRWVGVREARELLTYAHDIEVLEDFRSLRERQGHRARTLIVARHGKAASRDDYEDDLERPLTAVGVEQAQALVPLLAAYGVRRVVSSPAVRCAQTVEPYAHSISTFLEIDDRLAEDTRAAQVERSVAALLDRKKPVVLCSHRPTLPWVFDAIGSDVHQLATGEAIVVHHRKGTIIATEKLP